MQVCRLFWLGLDLMGEALVRSCLVLIRTAARPWPREWGEDGFLVHFYL
jgi:hypothetical protein